MTPYFLELDQVMRLHCSLVETYGGETGLRDMGLLRSALAMPQSSFAGKLLHCDLFEMAAAYLYHIVQNHPFIDGNKRTGAATAIVFLAMNGVDLDADEDGLVDITLQVAQGTATKADIAEFFRSIARD